MNLHHAIESGNLPAVINILDNTNNININETNAGMTPLHIAIINGHLNIVRELLNRGADPYMIDWLNHTSLHFAAEQSNLDIVKLLLPFNIDINVVNSQDYTALHYAVIHNHIDIVKELLYKGANTTIKTDQGETAFDIAIREHYTGIAKLIRDYENLLEIKEPDSDS